MWAPSTLELHGVLADGRDQAEFIQDGWPQRVGDAANIGDGGFDLWLEIAQHCNSGIGVAGDQVTGGIDALGQAGKRRANTIM